MGKVSSFGLMARNMKVIFIMIKEKAKALLLGLMVEYI
jgi:hypothetical protein